MSRNRTNRTRGFSLLELVVVVVIIGIIAAVAVPRLSRGSAGAADSALAGDLAVMRNSIDLYSAEHCGAFPKVADIENALLKYSDANGTIGATKDTTYIYGPYLRKLPPLPVGAQKGKLHIAGSAGATIAWIYDETTGEIKANTADTEKDATGKLYSDY